MAGLIKTAVRLGVIGTLVGGTAVVIAGPHRVGALLSQAKGEVNSLIDSQIDDPVALRNQLRRMEGQYPKRISEVRSELASLRSESQELERELAVSQKVVELAEAKLEDLQQMIARGEEARVSETGHVLVRVKWEGQRLGLDEAYAKANQYSQLRSAYHTKAADIERDLGLLSQQEQRLEQLLSELETERAAFQAQLWDLDRQVDAIARNEKLIEILDKRQRTLDELESPYADVSLTQIKDRLAKVRAEQESKLSMLANSEEMDLKSKATQILDFEAGVKAGERASNSFTPSVIIEDQPRVIEIEPESDSPSKESRSKGSRG